MRRPPLALIFLSVLLLALGTTAGAVMSMLASEIRAYATERIFSAREVHYLSGSRDYDADVVADIVFTVEAGLSFLHTHAEGMGLVLLFASTVVASVVRRRPFRALLYWLLGLAFLFPIGYAVYSTLVLFLGRERGAALAEQFVLIPFGTSPIVGLGLLAGALVLLFVTGQRRRPVEKTPEEVVRGRRLDELAWRAPGRTVILTSAVLLTVAELAGASIGRFKPEIDAYVTSRVMERPDVHGLVGLPDVDKEILDELRVKHDSALRLFHLHAQGLGLILFATALVTRSLVGRIGLRRTLDTLLTLGAFGFCAGYLMWAGVLPFVGLTASRAIAAKVALVPGGALLLIGLWTLTFLLALDLWTAVRRRAAADVPARGLKLPPVLVVTLSVLLLVTAHHVGVFVPRDDDVTTNFKEIKFAVEAGRFDVALRLFDDGVVHATMEKEEKRLPRGLEDGLRASLRGKDVPGVELRLAVFLTFMTRERLAFALERLRRADLPPRRRREQVRRVLDAAWRYYNLADFAVVSRDAKTSAALRIGFEDAYTYLGAAMVDPMWAGAASTGASRVDEAKAAAVIGRLMETSARFIAHNAALGRAGAGTR